MSGSDHADAPSRGEQVQGIWRREAAVMGRRKILSFLIAVLPFPWPDTITSDLVPQRQSVCADDLLLDSVPGRVPRFGL